MLAPCRRPRHLAIGSCRVNCLPTSDAGHGSLARRRLQVARHERPGNRRRGPDAVDKSKLATVRAFTRPNRSIPNCDVPFHRCQIHHIDYWENGGRTDLDNQVPLCNRHHHAVHEGGWTVSLDPDTRALTFQAPATEPPDYRCRRDSRPVAPTSPYRRTRS